MSDRAARLLASLAVAISLVALVMAGYALYAQQRSEQNLREIGRELQRTLSPGVRPMQGPPLQLDPDDT